MASFLEQLAQAYMERERQRLGIPEQERKAAEFELAQQAAKQMAALNALKLKGAESELAYEPTKRKMAEEESAARVFNLREPNHVAPAAKAIERTVDLGDKVEYIYTDGTRETKPKGKLPGAHVSINMGKPQLRQVKRGNKTVWAWIQPGEEVEAPDPAAMRQAAPMAATVNENVAKMEELANSVTAGPIAGRASKISQSVLGPHGPEGDFDFYGNAAVDLVYIKSGKQINENEMAILRQMIPNRARGNLPQQVKLFKEYANSLLSKYGANESAPDMSQGVSAESTGDVPIDVPQSSGGFRVVGVRKKQ